MADTHPSPDYIRGQQDAFERAAEIAEKAAGPSAHRDARWAIADIRAEKAKLPGEPTEAEVDAEVERILAARQDSRDQEIAALKDQRQRQEHMLDQASTLLEAAATVAKAAQDEAGSFHEKLDRAEAELNWTRAEIQRQEFAEALQPKDRRATREQLQDEAAKLNKLINEAARTDLHGRNHERFAGAYAALNWASDPASFDPVSKP